MSEFEIKNIEKAGNLFLERKRPPENQRNSADLTFRISGQSVEIVEIRPSWKNPSEKDEDAVARATFVKKSSKWKIYYMRCDMKWSSYDPQPEVEAIDDFFSVVENDTDGCFFK